jgi:hypothetical protein
VLHDGEADERRLLNEPVEAVVKMMSRLAGALARLTWITSGYGWLALVVPIVVAAPGYFSGHMSFGTLMMVVGAFNQVQSSLRWFVDNLPQIADWRATLLRVVTFRDALMAVDTIGTDTGRIEVVESSSDKLEFDDLQLALPEACLTLDQRRVEISPGEHVQILIEAGSDRSTLFRALAGMWPWGGGTLRLPPRGEMTFMPQRPYLPLGTLRAAVCYPAAPEQFEEAAVIAVLERLRLGHLVPSLDRTERWGDRQLPMDEQQRLAFCPRAAARAPLGDRRRRAKRHERIRSARRALVLRSRTGRGDADPHGSRLRRGGLLEPDAAHHRASGGALLALRPAVRGRAGACFAHRFEPGHLIWRDAFHGAALKSVFGSSWQRVASHGLPYHPDRSC